MSFSSRDTYDLWKRLIADEELYEAVIAGNYRELAIARNIPEHEHEILAWFHQQPGTRWNIENLRYRAAIETGAVLSIYLPRSLALLTIGNDDWLQDLSFEYLRFYRWDALGHFRLTECQRFGKYAREQIAVRRRLHDNFEPVLELELAAVEVLRQTTSVPHDAWEESRRAFEAVTDLGTARIGPGLAVKLVEQPRDIRNVMRAHPRDIDALKAPPGEVPVTWLVHVESLTAGHRMKVIGGGVCEVIARCTGDRTTNVIADELHEEFELPRVTVINVLRGLLAEGVLTVRGG